MSTYAKPYHSLDANKKPSKWKNIAPNRWQWTGESWVDEVYNCEPVAKNNTARNLVGSLMVSAVILAFVLAIGGCAITPQIVTTEVTKTADGFTIKSPKDVDATFYSIGPAIYLRYKSTGNSEAIKAGSAEASGRAAAVAKLAEAAATLGKLP